MKKLTIFQKEVLRHAKKFARFYSFPKTIDQLAHNLLCFSQRVQRLYQHDICFSIGRCSHKRCPVTKKQSEKIIADRRKKYDT